VAVDAIIEVVVFLSTGFLLLNFALFVIRAGFVVAFIIVRGGCGGGKLINRA